ncbi:hypothetical protein ACKVMT_16370 [Halobacteriales archaeon Cl-PHB]
MDDDQSGQAAGAGASGDRASQPTADLAEADRTGSHPFLFLAGLLLFLVSATAFVADLVTGFPVLRSLALNGLATLVLVGWAANDTLVDPDSEVATLSGAVGTALLLLAVYLLLAAVVLALSSPFHASLGLALWLGAGAVGLGVVGFLVFPVGAVIGDEDASA